MYRAIYFKALTICTTVLNEKLGEALFLIHICLVEDIVFLISLFLPKIRSFTFDVDFGNQVLKC